MKTYKIIFRDKRYTYVIADEHIEVGNEIHFILNDEVILKYLKKEVRSIDEEPEIGRL